MDMNHCLPARKGVSLVGVPIDNIDMAGALNRIEEFIAEGGFHQVATVNVNFLVNAIRNPELHQVLGGCDLVVPDGMPLLWFSRCMKLPLAERVPGVDMIPHLARLSAEKGYRIFFLGSSEKSATDATRVLRARYPGVNIVGHHCPAQRLLADLDNQQMLAAVREAAPDILMVGFGNPKQELWLARHRHLLEVPVCIGIGGSLDMLSGAVERAPLRFQQLGLEWAYRMAQEPRRLAMRYLTDSAELLLPLAGQMLALATQGSRRPLASMKLEDRPSATVAVLRGGLTAADCDLVEQAAYVAMSGRRQFVLDCSALGYLGADAMQRLIRLAYALEEGGSALWLTSPRIRVARVLQALRPGRLLRIDADKHHALQTIALGDRPGNYDGGDALGLLAIERQPAPS